MDDSTQQKIQAFFGPYPLTIYRKGETLIQAEQDPEGIYLITEGVVEQYDITPEGNKAMVNMFKPPAFFPMSWAVNRSHNIYFFTALTEVHVHRANTDDTLRFLQANPDVALDLLSRVYKGTEGLQKRLVVAASGMASNKLILALLLEAYRFGEPVDDVLTRIHIKQHDLAARSGLARETVSRELHKLADAELVTLGKDGITFDIEVLQRKLGISPVD